MRTRRCFSLAIALPLVAGTAAFAHHSYSATYDLRQQVTLEGKLVQFVFKNPHSFVTIQAPDDKGVMQRWSVEWSGTGQLSNQGVTRETLRVGDEIVMSESVARDGRVQGADGQPEAAARRVQPGVARSGEAVD